MDLFFRFLETKLESLQANSSVRFELFDVHDLVTVYQSDKYVLRHDDLISASFLMMVIIL